MVDKRRRSSEEIESEKTKKSMSDGDGGGGGINSLPDSVLHHVLSFLSMKQAVQTSLVSKRWRCLWTSIPTLNFTNKKSELMEFVDAVLILRDNNCNIQRYLTLKECGLHQKNLNISTPNLKRLVICENSRTKRYPKRRGNHTGSVRIYAPNLISFRCKDYLLKSYYLENVSSLVKAYIDMSVRAKEKRDAGLREKGRNAMIHGEKIDFSKLHNVKHLQLSSWALQILIATYGSVDSGFTEFQNLRSLKLQTWLSGECIRGIIWILNLSPNIVKLSLKIIEDTFTPVFPHWNEIKVNPSDTGDFWKLPMPSEEHAFDRDHLRDVEIRGLKGRVNELKFLEVLLKNAVVLEKLILVFYFNSRNRDNERRLIKYSEILHSFPKASSSVQILFISS